jgi:hypothetical protein
MDDFPNARGDGDGSMEGFFPNKPKHFRISGDGAGKWLIFNGTGARGFHHAFSECSGVAPEILVNDISECAQKFPNAGGNGTL